MTLNIQALFEDEQIAIGFLCPPLPPFHYMLPQRMQYLWPLQLTVTCTVLTSGLEMSLEAMHSYDPDCSLVMAVSSKCSPSVTNL